MTFVQELAQQRWDDHRYYHHSRINQSLHLFSAIGFLSAYVLLFVEPAAAVLVGWLLAMPSRQIGHFFFEPKDYDHVNQATHEHKERIKVGYNLRRKVVLLTIWVLSPLLLFADPALLGTLQPHADVVGFVHNVSVMWLMIGAGAVVFRTIHLFFLRNVQAGLVRFTKIMTDPFHDVKLYYKSPVHVLRGERFDPISPSPTA
jgi:hypothetical protein